MNYPLRLVKDGEGLWRGEENTDRLLLSHLTNGLITVKESEINDLRFLAGVHEWQLMLPGEQFRA